MASKLPQSTAKVDPNAQCGQHREAPIRVVGPLCPIIEGWHPGSDNRGPRGRWAGVLSGLGYRTVTEPHNHRSYNWGVQGYVGRDVPGPSDNQRIHTWSDSKGVQDTETQTGHLKCL